MNGKNLPATISVRKNHQTFFTPLLVMLLGMAVSWPSTSHGDELQECLLIALRLAEDELTVGHLRLECQKLIHEGPRSEIPSQEEMPVVGERMMEDSEHCLPGGWRQHRAGSLVL